MVVHIKPELEHLVAAMAERRAQSVSEPVEEALMAYLDAQGDDSRAVVRATRPLLPSVWPAEDFSDWQPPDAR